MSGDVVGYVLGTMKTVDEAVAFFKETPLYSEKVPVMNDILPTFHFAVTDPSGRSVVVEVIDGKTKIHENKVGVMTNDPPYDDQLKIWSKFGGKPLNEESFEAFDYSPEGRFCRMAAMNATQEKVPTDAAAVNRAWSMLNTVDIPKGILYWRWVNDDPQFTSYAVVGDLHNRVYYVRSDDNIRSFREVPANRINTGYFPWTLVDNYEWKEGRAHAQFGLFSYDRKTHRRIPNPAAVWYSNFIKANPEP